MPVKITVDFSNLGDALDTNFMTQKSKTLIKSAWQGKIEAYAHEISNYSWPHTRDYTMVLITLAPLALAQKVINNYKDIRDVFKKLNVDELKKMFASIGKGKGSEIRQMLKNGTLDTYKAVFIGVIKAGNKELDNTKLDKIWDGYVTQMGKMSTWVVNKSYVNDKLIPLVDNMLPDIVSNAFSKSSGGTKKSDISRIKLSLDPEPKPEEAKKEAEGKANAILSELEGKLLTLKPEISGRITVELTQGPAAGGSGIASKIRADSSGNLVLQFTVDKYWLAKGVEKCWEGIKLYYNKIVDNVERTETFLTRFAKARNYSDVKFSYIDSFAEEDISVKEVNGKHLTWGIFCGYARQILDDESLTEDAEEAFRNAGISSESEGSGGKATTTTTTTITTASAISEKKSDEVMQPLDKSFVDLSSMESGNPTLIGYIFDFCDNEYKSVLEFSSFTGSVPKDLLFLSKKDDLGITVYMNKKMSSGKFNISAKLSQVKEEEFNRLPAEKQPARWEQYKKFLTPIFDIAKGLQEVFKTRVLGVEVRFDNKVAKKNGFLRANQLYRLDDKILYFNVSRFFDGLQELRDRWSMFGTPVPKASRGIPSSSYPQTVYELAENSLDTLIKAINGKFEKFLSDEHMSNKMTINCKLSEDSPSDWRTCEVFLGQARGKYPLAYVCVYALSASPDIPNCSLSLRREELINLASTDKLKVKYKETADPALPSSPYQDVLIERIATKLFNISLEPFNFLAGAMQKANVLKLKPEVKFCPGGDAKCPKNKVSFEKTTGAKLTLNVNFKQLIADYRDKSKPTEWVSAIKSAYETPRTPPVDINQLADTTNQFVCNKVYPSISQQHFSTLFYNLHPTFDKECGDKPFVCAFIFRLDEEIGSIVPAVKIYCSRPNLVKKLQEEKRNSEESDDAIVETVANSYAKQMKGEIDSAIAKGRACLGFIKRVLGNTEMSDDEACAHVFLPGDKSVITFVDTVRHRVGYRMQGKKKFIVLNGQMLAEMNGYDNATIENAWKADVTGRKSVSSGKRQTSISESDPLGKPPEKPGKGGKRRGKGR